MSTKTVLVVDDDASMRGMVRSVLHREGFDVAEVGSGNDAIALLQERPYDAVVLDVMMRDGSGHEVLDALASLRPSVKCVVVVSATSARNIESVAVANVQAKLRKPFDIAELVAAIRQCIPEESDSSSSVA
jgi:DNA-binding response OmpR family regulator